MQPTTNTLKSYISQVKHREKLIRELAVINDEQSQKLVAEIRKELAMLRAYHKPVNHE